MIVVDAHEDLAWNILNFGLDYTKSAVKTRTYEADAEIPARNGRTLLGWPDWIRGRVAVIFATLFAAPVRHRIGDWDNQCYADVEEAHHLYRAQLEIYQRLVNEHPDKFLLISTRADLETVLAGWRGDDPSLRRVGLVILMEGADGVRQPTELPEWFESGVRILGPAWAGTRYAGGTGEPGPFTEAGYTLLKMMAKLGMILDLSHLAEEATLEALDLYPGILIASHSNSRTLLPGSEKPDRHLSDHVIRRIAERQGVIGIVLFNRFLKGGWKQSDGRQSVTLDNVVAQIDHICQITGDTAYVGIGSDLAEGFVEYAPTGIDTVADLQLIGEALSVQGYKTGEIEAFLGGNWLRMLHKALPET